MPTSRSQAYFKTQALNSQAATQWSGGKHSGNWQRPQVDQVATSTSFGAGRGSRGRAGSFERAPDRSNSAPPTVFGAGQRSRGKAGSFERAESSYTGPSTVFGKGEGYRQRGQAGSFERAESSYTGPTTVFAENKDPRRPWRKTGTEGSFQRQDGGDYGRGSTKFAGGQDARYRWKNGPGHDGIWQREGKGG